MSRMKRVTGVFVTYCWPAYNYHSLTSNFGLKVNQRRWVVAISSLGAVFCQLSGVTLVVRSTKPQLTLQTGKSTSQDINLCFGSVDWEDRCTGIKLLLPPLIPADVHPHPHRSKTMFTIPTCHRRYRCQSIFNEYVSVMIPSIEANAWLRCHGNGIRKKLLTDSFFCPPEAHRRQDYGAVRCVFISAGFSVPAGIPRRTFASPGGNPDNLDSRFRTNGTIPAESAQFPPFLSRCSSLPVRRSYQLPQLSAGLKNNEISEMTPYWGPYWCLVSSKILSSAWGGVFLWTVALQHYEYSRSAALTGSLFLDTVQH